MKNFMLGVVLGSVVGSVIGTIASDEMLQIKKKAMKMGKKMLKKCDIL